MLGLTAEDVIRIQVALAPTAAVRTIASHRVNGAQLIASAIATADREVDTARRAATLAVLLQVNQPFTDCNTRTATMCCYALIAVERGQWLRRKPYQVYGQVGHWGPRGDANAINELANFLDANMVGVQNVLNRWNSVMGQLPAIANQVAQWKAQLPTVSDQLQSWYSNYGY